MKLPALFARPATAPPTTTPNSPTGLTPRDVVEQGAGFVINTLRHLLVPENSVHDAAQDVFVVALSRLGEFEGRSSLRTWLYGIAVRVALGYRRSAVRARREAPTDELPDVAVAPTQEATVRSNEEHRALQAVLSDLEEPQRMAFVLYEIEQLPMKEVAEAMGCPLQTAYYRHQTARRRVLEAFERRNAKEEV